ncbi:hypothetical protein NVP1022O_68 [Vibrio phage 1.022.O._10N.286.45.A10]|nr:hypothetical protein NVP1022O_68 [Vibrio phage 1.022.O._10N.286.45.A10]
MITIDDSSYNGWFFESMVDGVGTGKCEKCGEEISVTRSTCLNLKPHDCDKNETQPTTK